MAKPKKKPVKTTKTVKRSSRGSKVETFVQEQASARVNLLGGLFALLSILFLMLAYARY